MENTKTKERLNELIFSKAYKKDFNELIHQILLKRKRKSLRFACTLIPKDWDGDFKKITRDISFSQFESILKSGNINDFWILIPSPHLKFINKWDIEYFFDPTENIPFNFNPFVQRFPVSPCFPSTSGKVYDKIIDREMAMANPGTVTSDHCKMYVGIDVRFPLGTIIREVKKQTKEWRDKVVPSMLTLKGRPKSKANTLREIKEIWEKTCKGKGLSLNQQAKEIKERLSFPLNENSIYKHYLRKLMARK